MTRNYRKERGAETQALAAAALRPIWPHATTAGAGIRGRDILHTPGASIEVKARRDLNIPAWLRQAAEAAGDDLPLLIHRPDGFGPATIDLWPATMRLADAVILLGLAGYGDQP